jgi:hypothetical protein
VEIALHLDRGTHRDISRREESWHDVLRGPDTGTNLGRHIGYGLFGELWDKWMDGNFCRPNWKRGNHTDGKDCRSPGSCHKSKHIYSEIMPISPDQAQKLLGFKVRLPMDGSDCSLAVRE